MAFDAFLKVVLIMAGVTYLIRMLPFVFVRGELKSRFLRSFLYYVPYAVLTAMTIPDIFTATGSSLSAWLGFAAAMLLSLMGKSLITVAAIACCVSLVASLFA